MGGDERTPRPVPAGERRADPLTCQLKPAPRRILRYDRCRGGNAAGTWKKPGRPRTAEHIRELVLKLARANIGDIRVTDERSVVNSNGNSKRIAEFRWSRS